MRNFITMRKRGDKILIGEAVFTVLDLGKNWVKLAVEAPDKIKIEIKHKTEALTPRLPKLDDSSH